MYDTVQVCEGCEGILYVECWSPARRHFRRSYFPFQKLKRIFYCPSTRDSFARTGKS